MPKQKKAFKYVLLGLIIVLLAGYFIINIIINRIKIDSAEKPHLINNTDILYEDVDDLTFSWSEIPELKMFVLHPTDFRIYQAKSNFLAYYKFQRLDKSKWNSLFISSLTFSDKNSITKNVEFCPSREFRCSAEEMDAVNIYNNLLRNIKIKKDYKDYHFTTLGGRDYFVHETGCEGDSCIYRSYISFIGGVQITIGSYWYKYEIDRKILDAVVSMMVIR